MQAAEQQLELGRVRAKLERKVSRLRQTADFWQDTARRQAVYLEEAEEQLHAQQGSAARIQELEDQNRKLQDLLALQTDESYQAEPPAEHQFMEEELTISYSRLSHPQREIDDSEEERDHRLAQRCDLQTDESYQAEPPAGQRFSEEELMVSDSRLSPSPPRN